MFVLNEGSEEYIIDGTPAELEEEMRRLELVGEGDDVYSSLTEFLDANDMYINSTPSEPEKLSVKEIAERWA